jgi:hypothetical protein
MLDTSVYGYYSRGLQPFIKGAEEAGFKAIAPNAKCRLKVAFLTA